MEKITQSLQMNNNTEKEKRCKTILSAYHYVFYPENKKYINTNNDENVLKQKFIESNKDLDMEQNLIPLLCEHIKNKFFHTNTHKEILMACEYFLDATKIKNILEKNITSFILDEDIVFDTTQTSDKVTILEIYKIDFEKAVYMRSDEENAILMNKIFINKEENFTIADLLRIIIKYQNNTKTITNIVDIFLLNEVGIHRKQILSHNIDTTKIDTSDNFFVDDKNHYEDIRRLESNIKLIKNLLNKEYNMLITCNEYKEKIKNKQKILKSYKLYYLIIIELQKELQI